MNGKSQKAKILIVDDDPFVRVMLKELLESSDYLAETAVNGADALEKYVKIPDISLIISDMNMDTMNGLELVRKLRKKDEYIPFVVLTVNTEIQVALDAIRSGANDYLIKDENIQDTILLSIKNVLEKNRLRLENLRLMEDLARKNRELERLSFLDSLTDIANRRYFDKVISQEWSRAARESSWISFVMIDIDFFKFYNDTYGHQAGDECLKKVAQALNGSLKRSGDFVARYGGEEFAAILPNTDQEGAGHIAEGMRANVATLEIRHDASPVSRHVTISLGTTSAIPSPGDRHSDIISIADKALYEAKLSGRNRVKAIPFNK